MKNEFSLPAIPITFWWQNLKFSCILSFFKIEDVSTNLTRNRWFRLIFCWTIVQWPNSLQTKHANCPQLHKDVRQRYREMLSIQSIASPGPQIVTIDSDSHESTMPYGFGRQLPIVPPRLINLNLPPNWFKIFATMAVASPTEEEHDENYIPHSPEPSGPSSILTPPMNLSTFEGWEKPHTLTDENTFYSDDESRKTYFLPSSPSTPPPRRKLKRQLSLELSFLKREGVSQHICEACGQLTQEPRDVPGSSSTN